jgi:2-haloacid dehalogenase
MQSTSEKAINHIVFDIGKVLIRYDREIPYRQLIPDEQERQWFLDTVCTPAWNVEQDRGRSWAEAEAELIKQYPKHAELIRAFRRHWHDMVPGPIDGSVNIMTNLLDRGRDVTLLTNFAADTFIETCERFAFLKATRGVTVSAAVGMIKPDAEIFKHHCESFGLSPAATLFIDDDQNNVNGAIKSGWQAILFKNAELLEAELEHLGL